MPLKDHYRTLGLDSDASASEIKTRFRELAKKHHPDAAGPDADATVFKEIGNAYDTLGNPEKRALYDDERAWGTGAYGDATHGGGWQHPHEMGASGGRGRAHRQAQSILGRAFNPRVVVLGVAAACGYIMFAGKPAAGGPMGDTTESEQVLAWRDPQTSCWTTPQPWNPRYAANRHTEQMIQRTQIGQRYASDG